MTKKLFNNFLAKNKETLDAMNTLWIALPAFSFGGESRHYLGAFVATERTLSLKHSR
jgi:hypothetical protein